MSTFCCPNTLTVMIASMPGVRSELSMSSTSMMASPFLLLRSLEHCFTTAMRSVDLFVVMRETSATERGGTG
eukprot:3103827-Heterocapsa_arctica.AAC.1